MHFKRLDKGKAEGGVEFVYTPQPEIRITLARINNPAMRRWLREHGPECRRELRAAGVPEGEITDRVLDRGVALHVVKGWRGPEETCTPELVEEMLVGGLHPHFREFVYVQAAEVVPFEAEQHEAAGKNFGTA